MLLKQSRANFIFHCLIVRLSDDSMSPKIVISIRKCLVVLTYRLTNCLISNLKGRLFCKWGHLISLLSFLFVCQTARSHLTHHAVTFAINCRHFFDGRVDFSHVSFASSFHVTVIVLAHILHVYFVWQILYILL